MTTLLNLLATFTWFAMLATLAYSAFPNGVTSDEEIEIEHALLRLEVHA